MMRHCAECGREMTDSYMFDDGWVCKECWERLYKIRNAKYHDELARLRLK